MGSSSEEMGSIKNAVLALLEFLVDPELPSKLVPKELSNEDRMAKQMHAVVLLYNYYHRKQNPALEFLDLVSFCKLALELRPNLLLYLRLMQRTDHTEVDDLEQHLSLTEKEVMKACDISKGLDASVSEPVIEGWPISKVAVFLVDFKRENCFLFHSSTTQGVWSVIEKELPGEEVASEVKNKKQRVIRKAPKENQSPDEAVLQQLAYSAIKEACDLNQGNLRILETHTVYSTSKAIAAARLYIMQCTQSKHDSNLVPLNDTIHGLQGPIVMNECGSWMHTSVVEYFHLLPYVDKVSNWLSRDSGVHVNAEKDFVAVKENGSDHSSYLETNHSEPLVTSKDDRDGDRYQSKVETQKRRSQLPDPDKGVLIGTNCQAKGDSLSFASGLPRTAKEVRSGSGHLNKDSLSLASALHGTAKEDRSGTGHLNKLQHDPLVNPKDDRNGNSYLSKVGTPKHSSQLADEVRAGRNGSNYEAEEEIYSAVSGTAKEVSRGCDSLLKAENLHHNSGISKIGKNLEDTNSFLFRRRNKPAEPVVYKKREKSQKIISGTFMGGKTSNTTTEYPRNKEERAASGSSTSMEVCKSFKSCHPVDKISSFLSCGDHGDDQKQMVLAQETHQSECNGGAIVLAESRDTYSHDHDVENVYCDYKISDTAMSDPAERQNHAMISVTSNPKQLHKIQHIASQTALKYLFSKREQLSQELRNIADEIAVCDRKIETILKGGEDELAVKLECLVEGCNDPCRRSVAAEGTNNLHFQDPDLPPVMKRMRVSEAGLSIFDACQELDGICNENTWNLPTYNLSVAEGGFRANVSLKGSDLECSTGGTICATPQQARNSAASVMLSRLSNMGLKM